MDFLYYVFCYVVGVAFGWYMREYVARRRIDNYFDEVLKQADDVKTMQVKVEPVPGGDTWLCTKTDGSFLIQVKDMEELKAYLMKEYSDTNVMMLQGDIDKLTTK